MKPKRILIDGRVLIRSDASGIPVYTELLLAHLFRIGAPHEFLLFTNNFARREPLIAGKHGVRTVNWGVPNRLLDLSSRFLHFPNVWRLTGADAIFSPHFNALYAGGAPRVVTLHDLSFLHHPYFFSRRQRLWHWLQDFRRQINSARAVIALSEFTKSDITNRLKVPPEKIQVIHSGIDPSFRTLPESERKEFRKRRGLERPYILYLGTLEPRKNVPAIIRAFNVVKGRRENRELRLVLAGRPGWLYKNILREAGRSPYREDIIFWGPVAPIERVFLYNEARVFVYPSFFEGFGFPPLEAQACGTPVVVADRTATAEIVNESGIRVNPWKTDELGAAIETLLHDGIRREQMIKQGFHNVSRFNWEKSAKKTLALLEHVAERNI